MCCQYSIPQKSNPKKIPVTIFYNSPFNSSTMKKIHFKKGNLSIVAIIILSVVIVFSTALLISGYWLGAVGLLPAAIIFSIREGVCIDLEKRMYKSYLSVFGISFAEWKPIPDGTRIGIRILKLVANRTLGMVTLESTSEKTTKELYLYLPKPERVVLTTSDNVKKLYESAQYISQHLGYEIIVDNRIPKENYS